MTQTIARETFPSKTEVPDLPSPGERRFWYAIHQPNNVKAPLLLELRQRRNSGDEVKVSFSDLIAKQPTIADPVAIREAAVEILIRAAKVDEFVGILNHTPKETA